MPAAYPCSNCHQPVAVDVGLGAEPFPEGGGTTETVTVSCPHCGAENTYLVPRQAGGRHPSFEHGRDLSERAESIRRE